MVRHLDDSAQVSAYADQGVTVVKEAAVFTRPRTLEVSGRTLTAPNVIIATGSQPVISTIEGLADVPVWTNREATTLTDIPVRAVVVGGSAVGVELSTFLARFGTQVTLVQSADRLLDREDPRVGELVRAQLSEAGVSVRTSTRANRARQDGTDTVVTFDDGSDVRVRRHSHRRGPSTPHRGPGPGPPASASTTTALSRSTSRAARGRGSGPSVTSPRSCRSPMSGCTRPGSRPTPSSVALAPPTTKASRGSCSAIRRSPLSG